MSILIGVGVVTTIGVLYMTKKGWHALHKAVGITPGVLVYQHPNKPLALADMRWRQLSLNKQNLESLTEQQLRQLHSIDSRVAVYIDYQQSMLQQNKTPASTEQQFVIHKLLHTRLPEMLASHHQLARISTSQAKGAEARVLLQSLINNIEQRLEALLLQMEDNHLQDLRVMKSYMDSHD